MMLAILGGAALAEIAGCFGFWAVWRLGAHWMWLLPAMLSLAIFAYLLTLVPSAAAGRVYAGYGGIYVVASLLWLWRVEGQVPDRFDLMGGGIILAGAWLILAGPR